MSNNSSWSLKLKKKMKNVILIVAFMLSAMLNFAQEDTTKMNPNEDINLEQELEDLEKGSLEFEKEIEIIQNQIGTLQLKSKEDGLSEEMVKEIELQIREFEKQVAAFEKGIAEIEKDLREDELSKLEENKGSYGDNNEDDEYNGDEEDFDFDWDFDNFDFWPFNKSKKFNGHWAGFELGLTNFLDANNEFELAVGGEYLELDPVKSWNYSLNFIEFNIPLHKKYFGIVSGVGFDWKSYNLVTDGSLVYDADGNTSFLASTHTISRNKLNVNSFTFPLLFELQIPVGKKSKRINVTAGVIGSIRVETNQKHDWETDDSKNHLSVVSDFNLSTFKYGYTLRVGYDSFQLYANYEAIPLFESGTGPKLYPFSVGIRLLDF